MLFGAPAFAGAVAPLPRGADRGYAARRRRRFRGRASRGGLWQCLQVGVRARVPLWGVSFAVSESQRPDDLVCFVQRRRSGACLVWCRGFRHCCVAVSKRRGWGADVPWLVRWCAGALLGVGVVDGHPRGGAFQRCEGRLVLGAVPLLVARPPGGQGSATHVSRVRSMRGCGPSTGPTACALAGRRCSLWGWRKGVPRGGAFHRCEGRLVSGAVPPPAARPLERAARVPRPVCPGCGRCGRGDPAPAPQRAPLRVGVARCGGGGRASPGGVLSAVARGAWCQALSLPWPPVLWSGQPGFRVPCVLGAVGAGVGIQHRPRSVRPCGPALLAAGVAEGRLRGGVLSTVVRGAWCQALSLPWPPVLWSGQPGFRVPRVPGAVGAGVGTQHRPHSVRPCGPALLAVAVAEGRPRGGAFHRCEGRLVSGAVPPSAARPLERAARVPRPVCPGCGWCGRGDPSPAPQRAPLRAGVARCEGGGKASPGGVPSSVVRGAWCQALSLPRPPVLWSGQPGFRDPCVPGAVDTGV